MSIILFSYFSFGEEYTKDYIQRLKKTEVTNLKEVMEDLNLEESMAYRSEGFLFPNPYLPRASFWPSETGELQKVNGITNFKALLNGKIEFYHSKPVHEWALVNNMVHNTEMVCALKFVDKEKKKYTLKTFQTKELAKNAGFIVTHYHHCGACSSLKDLAIYLEKRDMTEFGRLCTRKSGGENILDCHLNVIGLSRSCSEMWSYNSLNTKKACTLKCVLDYGLLNILQNKYPGDNVDEDGSLRKCLQCDELRSGPGYAYSVGRTRRSSGIESAIERGDEEFFEVDHLSYFK